MRRNWRKRKSRPSQTFWLVLGALVVGTIFTFGVRYMEVGIERHEALYCEGVFDSFIDNKKYGRHRSKPIDLIFADGNTFEIDRTCTSQELSDRLALLERGTKLEILLHPNSNLVLELRTEDEVIMSFDEAMQRLSKDQKGFFAIGIICYVFAFVAICFPELVKPKM